MRGKKASSLKKAVVVTKNVAADELLECGCASCDYCLSLMLVEVYGIRDEHAELAWFLIVHRRFKQKELRDMVSSDVVKFCAYWQKRSG